MKSSRPNFIDGACGTLPADCGWVKNSSAGNDLEPIVLRSIAFVYQLEVRVKKQESANCPDRAVEDLMKEIRREPTPHRILELAKALQAALDKRDSGLK